MDKKEAKFMAYDWDGGEFRLLPSNDVVEAIHIAWNYEFDVYEVATENLIFSGREDNEANSEMLEPYGIRLIDDGNYRKLQNVKTGEIYNADWQS
ncbi:hypothetical protein [Lederbergia galactosidilytica]|uniref:Uncharacterized protein n=1 Tax=Lederbergia galactosidilytica TaxID=217031 RepID=A0A177ZYU5_9BACI|nr:hypothetical protein [Lederbergia galactosidilytica]OAK72669.1 hypothetical protein ABB05_07370 [Lederbergia galactosidilytica]